MAYTALKKRLDDYPSGHKEYLESCSTDCEMERDMVDRIIKKSSQVWLLYLHDHVVVGGSYFPGDLCQYEP